MTLIFIVILPLILIRFIISPVYYIIILEWMWISQQEIMHRNTLELKILIFTNLKVCESLCHQEYIAGDNSIYTGNQSQYLYLAYTGNQSLYMSMSMSIVDLYSA